jgi:serine protease
MKKTIYKISALALFSVAILTNQAMAGNPKATATKSKAKFELSKNVSEKDYMAKTVLVKIDPSKRASLGKASIGIPEIQTVLQKIGAYKVNTMFPNAVKAANRMPDGSESPDISTIYKISYTADISVVDVINELLKNDAVIYAEPSYIYHINYRPNDPDTNSARNYYQKIIKAYEAWDVSKGDTNVVIGIIDTGGDLDHPDLAANVKKNYADPVNGLDDDGDGYIDNFLGWDFVGATSANFNEDGDPNVQAGGNDHGVHVGGDASAVADNNVGIAGVGFKSKLLFVKCSPDAFENSVYTGYEGIVYAADHGASVINCSWGGQGGGSVGQDVINYAISKNALVVAAAGNNAADSYDYFPTSYKGVLSVGSTTNTDRRSSFSNFGYSVDVSAPGSGIYSTTYNDSYASYDGTSMASPVAAGAAALVKAHFPSYNAIQVGEQLRVTCDDISSKNSGSYKDKLGKGRINVYKALTVSSPSIRATKMDFSNNSNGSFLPGDTVSISLELINYLANTSNLQVALTSPTTNVTVIGNTENVGVLTTSQKTTINNFKFYIKPSATENENVILKLTYTDGATYSDVEYTTVVINVSSLNITVNQISSTATGNGRIGYRNGDATGGLGVSYKGLNMLYEASFLVGVSSSNVSNNARSEIATPDEHFVSTSRIKLNSAAGVDYFSSGEFNDANNTTPINITVKHRELAWASAPDDKYFIVEYRIKNNSGQNIPSLFAGMFYDWDIASAPNNKIEYDTTLRMGYASTFVSTDPMAAVKILSKTAKPAYYGQSHSVPGDPQEGGYSTAEKYLTLSSGIVNPSYGTTGTGIDAMFTIGAGPYSVDANQEIVLALAVIAGDNLADLQASANAAQLKYDQFVTALGVNADKATKDAFVYPNPSNGDITIVIPTEVSSAKIVITDALGRVVFSNNIDALTDTYNLSNLNLSNGIYTVNVNTVDAVYVSKVLINE